jgi:anti-sigma B factor antagonist
MFKTLSLLILVALTSTITVAQLQQQQNANAYAYWTFGSGANDIENVDQKIWIAKPARGSQWVMTWSWVADPAHGGYLGFNTDDEGESQALFSLWNADKASGLNCMEFGGEGEGWSCRMPVDLKSNVVYRLRLARTRTDAEGVWWGAWIYQEAAAGAKTELSLGEIRVKKEMNLIIGESINNFSEYFGHTVARCSSVPVSILVVAPPSANRDAKTDTYQRMSRRNGGTTPRSNPCRSGNEPQGNMLKVEDINIGGTTAAVIFIGGTQKDHIMPKDIVSPFPTAVAPTAFVPKATDPKPEPLEPASSQKSRYSIPELTIRERLVDNVLILRLEGKLSKPGGTTALGNAIRGSLAEGKKNILLDLKGVTSVADGALAELIAGNTATEAAGGKVKLLDPSAAFQNELMITKFLTVFQAYDNEDEALASF